MLLLNYLAANGSKLSYIFRHDVIIKNRKGLYEFDY